MSFSKTIEPVKAQTKDLTRRLGWWLLKPGDYLWAVEKGQGLKKGEKVKRLALIRIYATNKEPLARILSRSADEASREGFPDWTNRDFYDFFLREMKCKPTTIVNRIQFEYVENRSGYLLQLPISNMKARIDIIEDHYQASGQLFFDSTPS